MKVPVHRAALWLHRYVGLALSVFLIVSGLTGSLLAYNEDLDAWLNPHVFKSSSPPAGAERRDIVDLAPELEDRVRGARVMHMHLNDHPDQAARLYVQYDPAVVQNAEDLDDEFFVDRHTGAPLGSRKWGDLSQGVGNLMPFVYRLHYALALGEVGRWILGIVALLWTVDCFVGAYLTFPLPRTQKRSGSISSSTEGSRGSSRGGQRAWRWTKAWSRSWLIRTSKLFGLVFTWHRASGLWLWGMLFAFAWSSVALNLGGVYFPAMDLAFEMQHVEDAFPRIDAPRTHPRLSWREAREEGRLSIQRHAQAEGFDVYDESSLNYSSKTGMYRYKVRSSRDVSREHPSTIIWLDGDTGTTLAHYLPTGKASGSTITSVLFALHFGDLSLQREEHALSELYRVFVAVFGVLVAMLSATGVWIWWRNRRVRVRAGIPRGLS